MGVVSDVQSYLEAQSLIGGSTGWDSVRRRLHDDQDQVVAITEDGGPRPEHPTSHGVGSAAVEDLGVQVMVRGARWDGDATQAKAEAIRSDLHGQRDVTLGGRTYIRVNAMTGEPVFAGFDENGRSVHTVAFRLLADQPANAFSDGFSAGFAGGG